MQNVMQSLAIIFLLTGCGVQKTQVGPLTILRGKAAIGAYMPEGSAVEVRGSAVEGLPSTIATSTVETEGEFAVDVSGLAAPYLVRVQDAVSNAWFYSYSDGTVGVANSNPYTDLLVRAWYRQACEIGGNPAHIDIDAVFSTGVYPSGSANVFSTEPCTSSGVLPDETPIHMPDPTMMELTGGLLSDVVAKTYLVDLENVMTANWVPGEGFDSLLDDVGIESIAPVVDSVLVASYFIPGPLKSILVYSARVTEQTGSSVTGGYQLFRAEILTTSASANVRDARSGHETEIVPMGLDSSSSGINTFSGEMQIPGLPAEFYQLTTAAGDIALRPTYYGEFSFAPDGSVTGFAPGAGLTIGTIGGGSFDLAASDFEPIYLELTARDSGVVLYSTTVARGSWIGSATFPFEPTEDFDLLAVGRYGERAIVRYQF